MTRKKWFQLFFVAGVLLGALTLFLRSEWLGEKVCGKVREAGLARGGVDIRIGHCQIEPWELRVDLRQVEVVLKPGEAPAVQADRANLRLEIFAGIFEGRIGRVELIKPSVNLDLSHVLDDKTPPKPGGTCRLNELVQEVPQANITITDGTAHLLLPGERVLDLGQLDLTARSVHRTATVHLTERGGQFSFPGGELPLDQLTVSGALDSQDTSVEISRLEFIGGQLSVLGKGTARNLCDPDLQVEASAGVPLDLVSALLNSPSFKAKGYATANIRMSGKLERPSAHAEVDVNDLEMMLLGQHVDPEDFTASLDLRDDLLTLQQFYWPLGEGYGKISGSMTLKDNFPFTATVDGKNIPFGELLNHLPLKHPWVDSLVNVKAKQTGHLFPTPYFSGPLSTDWMDFHVRTRAWDAPSVPGDEVLGFKHEHVDANFELDKAQDRIHCTKVHLTGPTAELGADIFFNLDTQKGLDLTADLKSLDLAEVGGVIAGLPWKGVANATAHITGPYGKQIIDAQLGIKDFTMVMVHLGDTKGELHFDPSLVLRFKDVVALKNGVTAYGGSGQLDFSHGAPLGGGDVSIADGRIEDLLQVLKDVHWSFDMLDGQMSGKVSGTIHLKPGPILAPTSDFDLHLSELWLYQRPMGAADFKMHTQDGDSITVPTFTVDGASGTFTFGGWQRVGGELNYKLTLKDVELPVVTAPELTDWDMTGTLDGALTITGPSQQAKILGDIYGSELTLFDTPVGYGHVKVHGEGASMSIVGPVGNDVRMNLQMRWEGALPMRARFVFDTDDLFQYMPPTLTYVDVSGKVHGTLDVQGNMKDSGSYSGRLTFPTVEIAKSGYVIDNRDPVKLAFHGDVFEFQRVSFSGRQENEQASDTHFEVTGTRSGPENRLSLNINGDADARLLVSLFPAYLDNASGELSVVAAVTGTQAKHSVLGSVHVDKGHFKIKDQDITADEVHGKLEFSQASVSIPEGLDGVINHGKARLTGDISLNPHDLTPSNYDLQLGLDESVFRFPGWPSLTVIGELDYVGPAADPAVAGNLDVHRFRYSENLDLKSVLDGLKTQKVDAQVYRATPRLWRYQGLSIDLGRESGDSVRVETNYLTASLQGHLDVMGDNARPILRGQITALPGAKATWQSNRYQVDDMVLEFHDQDRIIPNLEAHLTSQIRDYTVSVHLFGTPDNYHVVPSSRPQLSETDLLTLLNFNYTSQDKGGTNEANANLVGAGINTLAGLSGLGAEASKFLPEGGTVLGDPSLRLTTTYSLHYGAMEPTVQLDAKLLSKVFHDKLRVHYEQQPTTSSGTKAHIEYRLDNDKSLKLMYDGDNSDYTSFPDVGADFQFHTQVK